MRRDFHDRIGQVWRYSENVCNLIEIYIYLKNTNNYLECIIFVKLILLSLSYIVCTRYFVTPICIYISKF